LASGAWSIAGGVAALAITAKGIDMIAGGSDSDSGSDGGSDSGSSDSGSSDDD
jgi:hypothetical protein